MDLEKISYASFILDLTYQVLKQTESEEIFDLLKNALIKLEEGIAPLPLTNILELKYLDFLGVAPNIDSCCHCGSQKGIVTLSSEQGGYICKDCYDNEPLVSEKTIKMIRMYYYVDLASISKLDVSSEVTKEINVIAIIMVIILFAVIKATKKDAGLDFNKLVELLGGKDNIIATETNMSRFKVTLKDVSKANKEGIQKLGAKGIVEIDNQLKIILGSESKQLKKYIDEIK